MVNASRVGDVFDMERFRLRSTFVSPLNAGYQMAWGYDGATSPKGKFFMCHPIIGGLLRMFGTKKWRFSWRQTWDRRRRGPTAGNSISRSTSTTFIPASHFKLHFAVNSSSVSIAVGVLESTLISAYRLVVLTLCQLGIYGAKKLGKEGAVASGLVKLMLVSETAKSLVQRFVSSSAERPYPMS